MMMMLMIMKAEVRTVGIWYSS